jgi:E3 ubiquitin-protein ligase MARCH6
VPGDFIGMLFFLPFYLKRFQAAEALRYVLNKYWRAIARTLRLSSYFYGVRYEKEEVQGPLEHKLLAAHKRWITLKRFVTRSKKPLSSYKDMQMRVPYADSVALVKPRRNIFVEVDDQGIPTSDEGKVTAVLQDRVGRKANRRVKEDYTQVYMPALYAHRFWLFGMSLWVAIAWTCALVVFVPIATGRIITSAYFGRQVHDGYSFVSHCRRSFAVLAEIEPV